MLRLTRSYPKVEGLDILKEFYKKKKPAMFVANHCSWMDIPFVGITVGWRNYKLVSKKELSIVPILGTSIRVGGHIMVDRTDRRSQIKTLKQGISYLSKVSSFLLLKKYSCWRHAFALAPPDDKTSRKSCYYD